jgi:hypothetical protein
MAERRLEVNDMTRGIGALLVTITLAALPVATPAALTSMDFEGFQAGQALPANAYAPFSWDNEVVFDTTGTALVPPFPGPNVLARGACPADEPACELELHSLATIQQIVISGLTGGLDLFIVALDVNDNQVGGFLVVDTQQQSTGCAAPSGWSCERSFSFTADSGVRTLRIISSGNAVIDNVRVTTFDNGNGGGSLPEPSTLALAAFAVLGIAASRRQRQR